MSNSVELGQIERRLHPRYPIALDAEYRLVSGKGVQCQGSCRTVNISSGGVLVEVKDELSPLGPIELSIKWPCSLGGAIPLKLMVFGNIVRMQRSSIAVQMVGYEFRTAKRI